MVMDSGLQAKLDGFIAQEKLPADYRETVKQWFLPLAEDILHRVARSQTTLVVGVSGCQGSGKSTLAALLVLLLKELMGLRCINLSIDDFYLTRTQRLELAGTVHPLLATRGVPGTHDVKLALSVIRALGREGQVAIPRFNKAIDDRYPASEWPSILAPVDVVVIEGWCLSIGPQPEHALATPVNSLEALDDPDAVWRSYVNRSISNEYAELYALVDYLVMLRAPDFSKVFEWRQNQEDKLAASVSPGSDTRVMNREQLVRFIQHYERVTRHGLETLPARADVVFELTDSQTIAGRR
jgi:D-glycerate 3-kinase